MVLKKSNTVLNSGATQRVTKGHAYSGRFDPFTYQGNQISLQFSNFSAADKTSRSMDSSHTLEALNFIANHLGWEDLIDHYIFEKRKYSKWFPNHPTDIIVNFSLNKKKRWLLPNRLNLAVAVHNAMLEMSEMYETHEKFKSFPTELWDFIAFRVFGGKGKGWILPSRLILIRKAVDDMRLHDSLYFSRSAAEHSKELIRFGLMDRFHCVDLNVSLGKDSFGYTLRGQARKKSQTTAPPICDCCADKGQRRNELKDRKKKTRTHSRGIQRLSSWKTENTSKERKNHGESTSLYHRTKSPFQCSICSRQVSNSNDEVPQASGTVRDYVDVQVTRQPHVDARLLGFDSVIKKYGHLPYNAPRVAICKAKSRPSGRLGIHRGFTYARLKQEIGHALVELSESRQNFVDKFAAEDTCLNEDMRGKKSSSDTMYQSNENATNDMDMPKLYGKMTLQDFLVESKPKRKRRRRGKRGQKNGMAFESMSDSDNCLVSKDGRTSIQTFNNVSMFPDSHPSPDILIDWGIIDDVDSDNSFIWIDSDNQENWDSDEF